jgi:hypothetical protein
MYDDAVERMQVYLGEDEVQALERAARETGASRSELVRRAVRRAYGRPSREERLAAVEAAAGIWADRPFTGAEYIDAIRGDLDERLRRLGFD